MILKRTIRYVSYFLALFSTSATIGSCSKDDDELCYKCSYGGDSETICFDDFKDEYPDYNKDDFKDFIAYLESEYGADCKRK